MCMPTPYTTVAFWTLQTYTLALAMGIGASAAFGLYRVRKRPGALVDVGLGALIGGVALARLEHVLLNWNYFAYNVSEAFQLNAGGLDWHGALLGGLLGGFVASRWRQVNSRDLLDATTLALPLIAHAAWYGCWAANCAYGVEVDTLAHFPAWAVSEAADIYGIAEPRYNTQIYGLWLSAALLVVAVILLWRGWLRGARFWLILALFSAGMFVIGFFRGDYTLMLNGLRLDQWFDAIVGISGLAIGAKCALSLRNAKPIASRQ
jgi:phosphatidylglycerol:prolipoprotein diacylglycerol transferase